MIYSTPLLNPYLVLPIDVGLIGSAEVVPTTDVEEGETIASSPSPSSDDEHATATTNNRINPSRNIKTHPFER